MRNRCLNFVTNVYRRANVAIRVFANTERGKNCLWPGMQQAAFNLKFRD